MWFRELKDLALDTNFENVPLTIQVGQEIFIDNAELNIDLMMEKWLSHQLLPNLLACSDDYLKARRSDNIFCCHYYWTPFGSHNKNFTLEEHPNVNIQRIDSLSAGGEVDLFELKAQ